MRLYSNGQSGRERLQNVRVSALSEHRPHVNAVQVQRVNLLDAVAVAELIDDYRAGAKIAELARQLSVHRTTVTAVLRRHNVELRLIGLSPDQVSDASRLYLDGWSLAKLGEKFGVDGMTVRHYLRLTGLVMRSPSERQR